MKHGEGQANLVAWRDLLLMGRAAGLHFGFTFRGLVPVHDRRARYYGSALFEDGRPTGHIELRVYRLGRQYHALAFSTLKRILAHELAHLWCGIAHGRKHREHTKRILEFWKDL